MTRPGATAPEELAGPPAQVAVGVVAPFDFALDREIWRWTPQGVTLLLTRTPFVDEPVNIALAEAVSDESVVRRATRDVLVPQPAAVAYACTSGSFVAGRAGERILVEAMISAGARQAVTTSGALLAALEHLGIATVAVATPYVEDVTLRLRDFLCAAGVEVASSAALGLDSGIWTVPYGRTAQLVRAADSPAAEAVFVSCTNLPTYDLIVPLERELGKPVLTANQVTMWAVARMAGSAAVGEDQRLLATG